MRVRTQPWSEVVAFYAGLVDEAGWPIEPMLALVRFLANSPYAAGLFPYTSHDILGIGRAADFTSGDSELKVHFNFKTQTFAFTYIQRPDDSFPWLRECSAYEWQLVLEHILQKRLGWFHGTAAA